jgi:hypothetical protein
LSIACLIPAGEPLSGSDGEAELEESMRLKFSVKGESKSVAR